MPYEILVEVNKYFTFNLRQKSFCKICQQFLAKSHEISPNKF
jgi:hypothetical protein